MSLAYGNRVWETTNSTGTGNLALNGAVQGGYKTFAQEIDTHDFIAYELRVDGTNGWEIGYAQIIPGSPDQLVRYIVSDNSAGTTVPLDLSGGTHQVTSGVHKDLFYGLDTSLRNLLIGGDFVFDAVNGFKILPGQAAIDGLEHRWTSTLTGPGLGGHTINSMHYVYLYNNVPGDFVPLIEVSTTIPLLSAEYRYWAKSGDDSRRLIGFFRANASGAVHDFVGLRNGAVLKCFYRQDASTQVFNGQSTSAWTKVTSADQFIPQGCFELSCSIEMSFTNQNNANKIGLHPSDLSPDPVEAGLYRQSFSANRDTDIIEDSNIRIDTLKENPALYTRNSNNNGNTDYIINFDSAQVNLMP